MNGGASAVLFEPFSQFLADLVQDRPTNWDKLMGLATVLSAQPDSFTQGADFDCVLGRYATG